ncbi:hypothetical protein ACLIA0_14160 [Bacillaceae bacterium W0354]
MKIIEQKMAKNRFSGYQKVDHFHSSEGILNSWNKGVHEVISKDIAVF